MISASHALDPGSNPGGAKILLQVSPPLYVPLAGIIYYLRLYTSRYYSNRKTTNFHQNFGK